MAARFAVSLLAVLGSVAAQGYSNSSMPASTSSSAAATTTFADGSMPTVAGVTYSIQTDTTYTGTTLNLRRKRQSNGNAGIQNCLKTCSANPACAGTAYDEDSSSCSYYSAIDESSEESAPGVTFATVESRVVGGSTSSVNATMPTQAPSFNSTRPSNSVRPTPIGGGFGNMTSSRTSAPSTTSAPGSSNVPTPVNPPTGFITIDGVRFLIEINISYTGITIDIAIFKRAGYTLENCLNACAMNAQCAGTAFDSDAGTCTFYSSIDSGSRRVDNGTTFGTVIDRPSNSTTGSGNTNGTAAESFICPYYNGHVITSSVGDSFAIGCGEFLIGTTFDINTDLTKRQAIDTGLPQTLSNCVDLCSISNTCVGTVFDIVNDRCSFYSAVSYAVDAPGFDAATKVASSNPSTTTTTAITTTTVYAPGMTIAPGAPGTTYTATVYSVTTVYVTAPAGAAYPSGSFTSMVAVGPTTYVNNVPTVNPAGPATVTVTVNGNGAAPGGAYPTVTVHDTVSYCPAAQQTSFTTVWV